MQRARLASFLVEDEQPVVFRIGDDEVSDRVESQSRWLSEKTG